MKNDIAFINIGDELLLGSIADRNLQTLAKNLGNIGRYISEVRIIKDDAQKIIATVQELSKAYNVVFTSGGIGPTHDDITAICIATAFSTSLMHNIDAQNAIENSLKKRGKTYTDSHAKMALIPCEATLICNNISGAPGFKMANVYALAGVPEIFEDMVQNIMPTMQNGHKLHIETIYTNTPETQIANQLALIASQYGDVTIGIYPHSNKEYRTEIVVKSTSKESTQNCTYQIKEMLK